MSICWHEVLGFNDFLCCFLGCEVYNLGTGKGTSVLEMVSAFEKASGKVLNSSDV